MRHYISTYSIDFLYMTYLAIYSIDFLFVTCLVYL